jgi:lactate permease
MKRRNIMPWIQTYTPAAGSLGLSALVAAIPLVVIFVCLAVLKMKAHKAGPLAVASAIGIAITVWGMPVKLAGLSFVQGAAFGLFPVFYIVVTTIFLYNITVKGGGSSKYSGLPLPVLPVTGVSKRS